MKKWQVLLVDDEQDVHSITSLILKKKRWRKIPFQLTSAYSHAEAIEVLKMKRDFHVALVDVVMEKDTSGLELCEHIRKQCPSSMRIVLRTGQPGLAPEEEILNRYDIDYYLAKSDATPAKLYSVIRACLRSSQDISTLLAFGQQLQSFTRTLQDVSSVADLLVFMREALNFLEAKHSTMTVFNYDVSNFLESFITDDVTMETGEHLDFLRIGRAIVEAHERGLELMQAHPGADLGLSDAFFVVPFESHEDKQQSELVSGEEVRGGMAFRMEPELLTQKTTEDFLADAVLFIENWRIAFATVRLRERLEQEQLLRDQMYYERMESIATMVTGVAHELNTPLGVARTAGTMVTEIAKNLLGDPPEDPEEKEDLEADLEDSCQLLERNLDRAQGLIKSFKQLSSSQLSDDRINIELTELIGDCLETMRPDLKKHGITAKVHMDGEADHRWDGYPGHLSQVIINLVQNTIRYAYPEEKRDGTIDIFVTRPDNGDRFCIEYVDYGKGVDPEILPRLFDAFVTSGRSQGGTGLGMAISRNIVVELLGGTITCDSSPGKGAKFTIDLPVVTKVDESEIRRLALKRV